MGDIISGLGGLFIAACLLLVGCAIVEGHGPMIYAVIAFVIGGFMAIGGLAVIFGGGKY